MLRASIDALHKPGFHPMYKVMLNFYREVTMFHLQVVNDNSLTFCADTKCYLTVINFLYQSSVSYTSKSIKRKDNISEDNSDDFVLPKRTSSLTIPQMHYTPVSNRSEDLCK
ncbi:hypothetical protein TNIN_409271 [Trichonephila inaurata madagascariensis]|uniref:Uncharacterized protein n=1 Tax=Trichonephila inaurata madagascariensis TaxID=2747483 RepID=A0A8X6YPG1_9ARAC|nr:hypothetical protein TNIN_409271 [Trichonephila inaurata madagascariensis]